MLSNPNQLEGLRRERLGSTGRKTGGGNYLRIEPGRRERKRGCSHIVLVYMPAFWSAFSQISVKKSVVFIFDEGDKLHKLGVSLANY